MSTGANESRDHLHIGHKVYPCNQCLIKFGDKESFDLHEHVKACKIKACWRRIPSGLSLFGDCDCLIEPEYRWLGLYRLCFPGSPIPQGFADGMQGFPKMYEELSTVDLSSLLYSNEIAIGATSTQASSTMTPRDWMEPTPSSDVSSTLVTNNIPSPAPPYCFANNSQEQANQLYGIAHEISQTHYQLGSESESRTALDQALRRIESLEQRLQRAEAKIQKQYFTRRVLDVVWEEFQESGHPKAEPGKPLAALVAGLPTMNGEGEEELPQPQPQRYRLPTSGDVLFEPQHFPVSTAWPEQSFNDPMISGGIGPSSQW